MKDSEYSLEKDLLKQAILHRSVSEVEQITNKLGDHLSAQEIGSLLFELIKTLPAVDMAWCYANLLPPEAWEEMQQEALGTLCEILLEKGMRPGRDFSTRVDGINLSLAAKASLLEDIPEDSLSMFEDLIATGAIIVQDKSSIQLLEERLGMPFIDNLLQRIEQRLPSLSDQEAATYFCSIFQGVEARTGIPMLDLLAGHFHADLRFAKIFEVIQSGELVENNDWVFDLVAALGGESEFLPDPLDPEQKILTDRGNELLALVYQEEIPFFPFVDDDGEEGIIAES